MNVELTVPGPLRIRVTDLKLLMEAVAYFERSVFTVRVAAEAGILELQRPMPAGAEAERETLEMHLGVWRAMYPDRPLEWATGFDPGHEGSEEDQNREAVRKREAQILVQVERRCPTAGREAGGRGLPPRRRFLRSSW
jgi:hypothetical protein